MKKFLFTSLLIAGSLRADLIPFLVSPGGVTAGPSGSFLFNYNVVLDSTSKLTNAATSPFVQFFTIYDFFGFTGFTAAPAGWTFVGDPGLTPPLAIPVDDPTVPNITFKYTGTGTVAGPQTFTGFQIGSIASDTRLTSYAGQSTKQTADANNTMQDNVGKTLTPLPGGGGVGSPVPEPMAMSLMGGGLSLLALLHRRIAKK
jgi:hypothetical protein